MAGSTTTNAPRWSVATARSAPSPSAARSRSIAAEKANTANALSLDKFALSTANLYAGAQPAGFLYGLINTDPPSCGLIAMGKTFGSASDPLTGKHLGGIVVFAGGLALYN